MADGTAEPVRSPLGPGRAGNIPICCRPFLLIIGKFWRVKKHPVVEFSVLTHKHQKYLRSSRLRFETPRTAEMDFILRHCSLMHFCYSTLFLCLVEFLYCLFNVLSSLVHLWLLRRHQRHISHMHRGWEVGGRARQRFQLHPLIILCFIRCVNQCDPKPTIRCK